MPEMATRGASSPPPAKRAKPALHVETGASCVVCGLRGAHAELMGCRQCGQAFHPACANLPAVPEDCGACFCRWSCFTAFHKPAAAVPGPHGDFPRLAAQIHEMLYEKAATKADRERRGQRAVDLQPQPVSGASGSNGLVARRPPRPTSAALAEIGEPDQMIREQPPPPPDAHGRYPAYHRGGDKSSGRTNRKLSRSGHSVSSSVSPSPSASPPNRDVNSYDGRSISALPSSSEAAAALRVRRSFSRSSNEVEYPEGYRAGGVSSDAGAFGRDKRSSNAGSGRSSASPSAFAPVSLPSSDRGAFAGSDQIGRAPRGVAPQPPVNQSPDLQNQRGPAQGQHMPPPLSAPAQSRLPTLHSVGSRREFDDTGAAAAAAGRHHRSSSSHFGGSSHGSLDGSSSSAHFQRYGGAPSRAPPTREGAPGGRYISSQTQRAPSPYGERGHPPVAGMAPSNGKAGLPTLASSSAPPMAAPSKEADVPWLNPSAFPTTIYERFKCHADDLNRVFRVDLTRAFAEKATHLYQSEIDFFFRCFESSDVSLVVNGMASDLSQCMWAWPFILESCGTDAQFLFDHFQYKKRSRDGGLELEYVGELKLSLGDYSQYLEKYLSNVSGKEAVVLEDHAKKVSVTLLAADNVIALNTLVIAQSCTKLYSDLRNSFQWDVFAGGIHCLLQYLPESCRKEKFSSPLFHLTFPGSRGALCDPGNGTTDTAYQVLVGCLELVIFERMEPRNRDEFVRILQRAGYHAEKKPMLQEIHLRALSSAGFVWTTVKIHDGEFIHINKGRMHFWRTVSRATTSARAPPNEPCVFLSWEWVYQGVSQRGISNECWFAMKNASLCSGGWAFDPRRAIIEAAKAGVATVRSGQFLTSRRGGLPQLLSFCASALTSPAAIDSAAVNQRRMQMVLFLESILQCLKTIVDDEYDLALAKDDSDAFGKRFDGEAMWKVVDAGLARSDVNNLSAYECGICGLELTNIYKQCLGCTAYASTRQPNMSYQVFRICLRCHAHPKHHHFKPRALHGYFGRLLSCEGHTGAPQSVLDPRYFECACSPSLPCVYCGGCQSCSCVCHTQFQTRFRFALPEALDHLRFDVDEVIKQMR